MKKYLNKNIFYQGDANILSLLSFLLICTGILLDLIVKGSYFSRYSDVLYSYNFKNFITSPLGTLGIILLVVFLLISFMLICGMFKRKKWSTLLSGPFSKLDIRKRELILILGCVIAFILMYLIACLRFCITNDIIISYITGFELLVILDIVRIIFISLAVIAILFLIDSITSNIYITLVSLVSILGYIIMLVISTGTIISRQFNFIYNTYGNMSILERIRVFAIEMIQGIVMGELEYMNNYHFIIAILLLLLVTIIASIITLKLIKKIRIEKMQDMFIFDNVKKIVPYLIASFIGMTSGNLAMSNFYFYEIRVSLNGTEYNFIFLTITIISTIIVFNIIKYTVKLIGNKVPKKYI